MASNLPLHCDMGTSDNIRIRVEMALDRVLAEVGFVFKDLDPGILDKEVAMVAIRWGYRLEDKAPPPFVPAKDGVDEPERWPVGTGVTKVVP